MTIKVSASNGNYNIVLQRGAIDDDASYFDFNKDGKVLIVTDNDVPIEYIHRVAKHFQHPYFFTLPQGEKSKNVDNYLAIMQFLLKNNFTRHDSIISVGGGMVGDLSGFVAATYMRGVAFYNIPTTFLAQVDASIGGKTAINLDGVKNVVGSFYQPRAVIIDPTLLASLPPRQLNAGIAESIKMAIVGDAKLFSLLENAYFFDNQLEEIIRRSIVFKKSVIERDPKEQNIRKVLNFGHTIGHAIESEKQGSLLHGECIALGMLPFSSPKIFKRIKEVLQKYSLPVKTTFSAENLSLFLCKDKKAETSNGLISVVYATEIGKYSFQDKTIPEIIKACEVIL